MCSYHCSLLSGPRTFLFSHLFKICYLRLNPVSIPIVYILFITRSSVSLHLILIPLPLGLHPLHFWNILCQMLKALLQAELHEHPRSQDHWKEQLTHVLLSPVACGGAEVQETRWDLSGESASHLP